MKNVKRSVKILLLFFLVILFIGCKEEKFGIINLHTWKNIDIYIDNKFKAVAGEGVTKIKLSEGNHQIKVVGNSADGEWYYEITKKVYVAGDVETNISLIPVQYPSKKRLQRIENQKRKKLEEAKKYGCNSIEEFQQYKKYKKEISVLNNQIETLENERKILKKDTGYITPNDYLDLVSFSINNNVVKIKLKNKTKNTITYFWSWFYLVDNKLNVLTSLKEYKEYIKIKPFSTKTFNINLSSYNLRDMKNKSVKYLFMNLDSVRYNDHFGTISKDLNNINLRNKIQKVSDNNYKKLKYNLKETKNKLSNLCSLK